MRTPRGRSLWSARLAGEPGSPQGTILDELRRVILAGDAPPGTTIPVDDVAGFFDVSRIPVREALKTLVGEGLVTQRPRSDFTVARLTHGELQEFYTVRGLLELALVRPALACADDADDRCATSAHDAVERAIDAADARAHQRESRRFHFALLRPAGMDRMLHLLGSAWNMTEPVRPMAHAAPADGARFTADHARMLAAFLARDAAALESATRDHNDHLAALIAALPAAAGLVPHD